MGSLRYNHLTEIIRRIKPQRILEIGTYKGKHARQMIEEALHYGSVEYYGFDLFERPPLEEHASRKVPPPMEKVQGKLEKTGAKIFLYKGNTRATLGEAKLPLMDFIFIDGGHSVETVRSDWKHCEGLMHERTVAVFDDYWNSGDAGCKQIIDDLPPEFCAEVLEPGQVKPGGRTVHFVKVTRKI